MKISQRRTWVVLFIFLTICVSCSSPADGQKTGRPEPLASESSSDALPDVQEGTLTGKVNTTIDMSTGVGSINGVGVLLDDGGTIDAYLPKGIIDIIMKDLRVTVVQQANQDFAWTVTSILPDGVPTPDARQTQEAKCTLTGATLEVGENAHPEALNTLSSLITASTQCEVEFIIASDTPDLIPLMFQAGEANFALLPASFYYAMPDHPLTPILMAGLDIYDPMYRGAFIVAAGSDHQAIADLEGKKFAFTNKGSLLRYQMPLAVIAAEGFNPDSFFSEMIEVGNDSANILNAVSNGTADVAMVWANGSTDAVQLYANHAPAMLENLRIIAYSPWIPEWIIAVDSNLDPEIRVQLETAFLSAVDDPQGNQALYDAFGITFIQALDERFWETDTLLMHTPR